jgi:bifunctional N-acetylglucosamine-1-phosphate-uridyltransferase/glucosamine-1-phosphate-acetyltransferase GlmU-like protein
MLDMFDRENDDFTFICNNRHLADNIHMREILQGYVKKSQVIAIPPHKYGPVYTIHTSMFLIPQDEPVIIAHCDTPLGWDYEDFKQYVGEVDADGCIVSHTGFHPHTLSKTMMAYSKTAGDRVLEVKEKACYTNNRFEEHASSGVYYFKKGSYVTHYFSEAIDQDINYNGEYYVTLVYNLLIENNLKVYSYVHDYVMSLGTPSDLQNYEAWQRILDGDQAKNEEDMFNCYNYWKYFKQC